MLEDASRFFDQFAESVRFADLLDVLMVAAFLYALLTWVRRDTRPGTTWRLSVVLVSFAAVYLLAGAFSMFLVERLLGVLFGVFLVAMVVLFQAEIRRMIDRIGAFSFRRPASGGRDDETLDLITEAAGRLASKRVGALIALRGRDSWEGITKGGVELNGNLSMPLLESIFHEDTDGHDGAVLIERDRAVRFGVHLPLASELPPSSEAGGTRHAAALGLAEQSDAFVIVVSEERGVASVAENGHLVEMESTSDLRERLVRFWKTYYEDPGEERWWSRASVQTALLALLMSSLFWLTFAYEPGSTQRAFTLPVAFRNVEPTWLIGDPDPSEVRVTLTGSERAFRLIEPSDLAISFPQSDLRAGENELIVSERRLDLPGGLAMQEARPQRVEVEVTRLHRHRLPVRVNYTGTVPDSLRLRAVPDSVEALVPQSGQAPAEITTESFNLDTLTSASGPVSVNLVPPERGRLPERAPRSVKVQLE